MFMNKISMSQTCLYSIQKATKFFQQPVAYSIEQSLNYSGLLSVATGCCENPVSFLLNRQVCDILILFMNMYP